MMGYPEDKAVEAWEKDGVRYAIVDCRGQHFCGYARFPTRPLAEEGYDGIATYVPVHGGITYAQQDADGSMVYGFDCAHHDSGAFPTRDMAWLRAESERMAVGILKAKEYEGEYLIYKEQNDNGGIGRLLDIYHAALKAGYAIDFHGNFGTNLALLSGQF